MLYLKNTCFWLRCLIAPDLRSFKDLRMANAVWVKARFCTRFMSISLLTMLVAIILTAPTLFWAACADSINSLVFTFAVLPGHIIIIQIVYYFIMKDTIRQQIRDIINEEMTMQCKKTRGFQGEPQQKERSSNCSTE